MFKYSFVLLATVAIFSGCGSEGACCNGDREEPKAIDGTPDPVKNEPAAVKNEPVVNGDPVILKKPTAVITPGDCDDDARYFSCIKESKDNDNIDPTPDIGLKDTSIVKCEWTIKPYNFDNEEITSYSTFIIYDVNGEVDPTSTSEDNRWIGHDDKYKIIELTVIDDDGQKSDTVIKKFDYSLGACGELVDP